MYTSAVLHFNACSLHLDSTHFHTRLSTASLGHNLCSEVESSALIRFNFAILLLYGKFIAGCFLARDKRLKK